MTTVPQPKDATKKFDLKYDAWNRLVEVKNNGTTVQENEFDGLNRRIVRDETGGSGVVTHFYYNRQWQVAEERVGSATTADKQYIYHPNYVDAVAGALLGRGQLGQRRLGNRSLPPQLEIWPPKGKMSNCSVAFFLG